MRSDTPAALPLIALVAGLTLAPAAVHAPACAAGLLAVAALSAILPSPRPGERRHPVALLFGALGLILGSEVDEAPPPFPPDRFVTVVAPLERDWAPREESFLLRASHFAVSEQRIDTPLTLYARFDPPEMRSEAAIRAEGFLRENERGEYTLSVKSPRLMAYEGELAWWHPAAWNRALANRLERHAGKWPEEVALAQALLLGRGERLSEETRENFRNGGTYHLLVFSALQIAFAAGLLAALLRWLHAPRASDWLLLLFAILAPPFIGPTASVSRASIGIALYAISRILSRPTSIENLWCVAAIARLALVPEDLTDPSFHLTYAGAGALLFIGKHLFRRRWLSHALAAEIAVAPLTLAHFGQYALGGSLLTLAMSPVIFAMLVVSALACVDGRFLAAIGMLHRICTAMNSTGLSGYFAPPPRLLLAAAGFAALLALVVFRERRRALALVAVLLVPSLGAIAVSMARRSVPNPRVTFFDVGQGDAIAVRSGSSTLLVDGGRDRALLPRLAARGIQRIDTLLLTHTHPDHCGSLPAIVSSFEVGRVLVSPRRFRGPCAAQLLAACSSSATPLFLVKDGDRLDLGEFAGVVHAARYTFRRNPENNGSVVVRIAAQNRSILLTGDIEQEAELYFDDRDLRADVLKVAHHGSRTSTSEALLEQVAPRVAVISCGRRNLFGHPHPDVVERLHAARVRTWRTDRDGTVDLDIRGGRLYVRPGND